MPTMGLYPFWRNLVPLFKLKKMSMKKYLVALSAVGLLAVACGSNSDNNADSAASSSTEVESQEPTNDLSQNPDYKKGLKLVAQNDCLTCHKVSGESTGPAYEKVAEKYTNDEATIQMLADKIIKGGSGNWGSVPMTAHPTLSPEDAQQMVKYIFL